jgi:hypothetical protein
MMGKKNQEEQKEPKFKVVDRRRIDPDKIEASDAPVEPEPEVKKESSPKEKAPETTASPKPDSAEIPSEFQDTEEEEIPVGDEKAEFDPLEYRNLALSFLQTLSTAVWVQMGLIPHPQTQLVIKKMEDARKTINLIESLYKQAKGEWPEEINMQIERLIADLKANYVNQL